jgi:hypothetical protein
MIRVYATIEGAERTSDEFKQARREVNIRTRSGVKRAGERAILPFGRRETRTHTPVDPNLLIVKTTSSGGYMTLRTRKANRIVGLLNYGGKLGPVRPKKTRKRSKRNSNHAAAIKIGGGFFAATGPRQYKAGLFLERARDHGFPRYREILLTEVMQAFDPLDHTP